MTHSHMLVRVSYVGAVQRQITDCCTWGVAGHAFAIRGMLIRVSAHTGTRRAPCRPRGGGSTCILCIEREITPIAYYGVDIDRD